ncbi:MAG: UvrD-helicase domain-containing protein [Planctomycetes bacterium]|nr:UvrD-helicase domain-containing protein [Planctomycetota bacterium]
MTSSHSTRVAELLAELTEPQREAVLHTDGPLLVIAGPGSGKTRVVTRRAAHLALTAAPARQILAITFTNKAAREMRERIDALSVAEGMTVCTFHALCAKLLRIHHERARVPRNFTIFDRDDRRRLLKQAIEDCQLSTTNWSPASVEGAISTAKNDLRSARAFAPHTRDWREATIARIYERYETLLAENAALDFDDLLMRVALLLRDDEALRDELEDRYRYVLIDEYQDTNAAQYLIARKLVEKRQNLCATGDPDQSIYGWRGANLENILSFEHDFPSTRVVRLEQNYRSTQRILAVADALIAGNRRRKLKALWTQNEEGPWPRVLQYDNSEEEAAGVARDISQRLRGRTAPGGIAVFYRVNSLSRAVEEALLREGIKYQVARGVEFYNRKEVKDVLAYLRVLVNPADEVALFRIINTPARGIGDTTLERLREAAGLEGVTALEFITSDRDFAELGRAAVKVRQFGELLRSLRPAVEQRPATALGEVISRTGLRAMYMQEGDREESERRNLDELINAATLFQADRPEATLIDWLEYAALVSDVDSVEQSGAGVTLMTLHAAKGLEFDVVYIIGLEDGLLPFRRDEFVRGDEEEERRLCFVGMTRARKVLTLSRARQRFVRGSTLATVRSPFLDELPPAAVEWSTPADAAPQRKRADAGRLPEDLDQWTVGTLVRHPVLGLGQVLSLTRGGKRTHVDVQFQSGPKRSWALEFADLVRVDFDEVE